MEMNGKVIVNDELRRIQWEVTVAYLKFLFYHFPWGIQENNKSLPQDMLRSGRK